MGSGNIMSPGLGVKQVLSIIVHRNDRTPMNILMWETIRLPVVFLDSQEIVWGKSKVSNEVESEK